MSGVVIGGRYLLEQEVGRGGMGSVWQALDQRLQRRVAVKRMSAEQLSRPAARLRFEQEALAVAQLRSPHVVQIHDYGIDDGAPYLVMELLDGEDLNARFQRLGKLPPQVIATLVAQIARALDAAHAAGIIHRDLKPDNVFLARDGGEEIVKVLDFGVAGLAASLAGEATDVDDSGPPRKPGLLGTPHYMSPEQVRGSKWVDHRSDLWALGVLAYRGLTGKLPFTAEVVDEVLLSVCVDTPEPASRAAPEIEAAVDAFFERALEKDPAQRFYSGRELSVAFSAALSPAPRPAKLLVVDDEKDAERLLRLHFRKEIRASVYELMFVQNGQQALDALQQYRDIDVTLTDIRMPGMDGLSFLARARELRPDVPVLVISAFGDMSNIRTAMNHGAFDFLVKPLDFGDLDATLQKALDHARELRTAARSSEQNAALRMFVGAKVAAQLGAPLFAVDSLAEEVFDGTVVFARVSGAAGTPGSAIPGRTVRHINANLEVVIPELIVRGGVIEKIFGSALIAVFHGDGHMVRALGACVSVRDQLARLAAGASEQSPYAAGICAGIASGSVIRGCIGSKAFGRLDYAVLGDVVSTAARLMNRAARGEILAPEAVRLAAETTFEFRSRPRAAGPDSAPDAAWRVVRKLAVQPVTGEQTVLVEETHASLGPSITGANAGEATLPPPSVPPSEPPPSDRGGT